MSHLSFGPPNLPTLPAMASPRCRRSAPCGCWASATGSWGRRCSTPWSPRRRSRTCARWWSSRGCLRGGNLGGGREKRRNGGEALAAYLQGKSYSKWVVDRLYVYSDCDCTQYLHIYRWEATRHCFNFSASIIRSLRFDSTEKRFQTR